MIARVIRRVIRIDQERMIRRKVERLKETRLVINITGDDFKDDLLFG